MRDWVIWLVQSPKQKSAVDDLNDLGGRISEPSPPRSDPMPTPTFPLEGSNGILRAFGAQFRLRRRAGDPVALEELCERLVAAIKLRFRHRILSA